MLKKLNKGTNYTNKSCKAQKTLFLKYQSKKLRTVSGKCFEPKVLEEANVDLKVLIK